MRYLMSHLHTSKRKASPDESRGDVESPARETVGVLELATHSRIRVSCQRASGPMAQDSLARISRGRCTRHVFWVGRDRSGGTMNPWYATLRRASLDDSWGGVESPARETEQAVALGVVKLTAHSRIRVSCQRASGPMAQDSLAWEMHTPCVLGRTGTIRWHHEPMVCDPPLRLRLPARLLRKLQVTKPSCAIPGKPQHKREVPWTRINEVSAACVQKIRGPPFFE